MNIIRIEVRKARKINRCMFCGRTINVGDRYEHQDIATNGTVFPWDSCLDCLEIIDKYKIEGWDGLTQDEYLDSLVDICKEKGIYDDEAEDEELVRRLIRC